MTVSPSRPAIAEQPGQVAHGGQRQWHRTDVDLDPAPFTEWITACGLEDATFTTLARELGRPIAVDEVRALGRLRDAARVAKPGQWLIVAGGWTEEQFKERRRPTQAELIAAAPNNPVYVQWMYGWAMLTPAGMQALKRGTKEPDHDLAHRIIEIRYQRGLLLFALVFAWIAFRQAAHRSLFGPNTTFTPLLPGQSIPVSTFVWTTLALFLAAALTDAVSDPDRARAYGVAGRRRADPGPDHQHRQLPPDLATFFPRLVDYNLAPDDTFLTLEYYGYPTLSEVWAFEEFDAKGVGWNQSQSKISVGSGGLAGKGWTEGTQAQLGYLPRSVAHNDFIFSVIAEEKGFLGSLTVLSLFGLVLFNGIRIAGSARDRFGTLLAIGVTVLFMVHVFVNIAMTIGLVPITGIPLPFISYGGSFVLSCCLLQGLVQSVWRFRKDFT